MMRSGCVRIWRSVTRCAAGVVLTLVGTWAIRVEAMAGPSCRVTLDSLDSKTRANYAGYLLEVTGQRQSQYISALHRLRRLADTSDLSRCYSVLSAYAAWYKDPHLFVFQSQSTDSATAMQRASSVRRLAVTEESVRATLGAKVDRDPLEGIWQDGALRIAVVPDPGRQEGLFLGVVVASDTSTWPVGSVRAEFRRNAEGSYRTTLLTRQFAEMQLAAQIYKKGILRLSPGLWGKVFPVAPADTGLVDSVDAHRPRVSVRERSVVFSVPSHDPQHTRLLDSLVRVHAEQIKQRPLLIVDLRGNEGGGSQTTRALHPYVSSRERGVTPYDSGDAVMLSSPAQVSYARRAFGAETSPFVRSLVSRLEASPGTLVPLDTTPSRVINTEASVSGDWRVAVLVDGGTVSASEMLVLRALRSSRAVVIGEPTAGSLDYQSIQIVSLGTGDRRWALGYPTITAHAELPRRGMRGKGIAPTMPMRWSDVADPMGEVERRVLAPSNR